MHKENYEIAIIKNKPYFAGSNSKLAETEEEFNKLHNCALELLKIIKLNKIDSCKIATKGDNFIKKAYIIAVSKRAIDWYIKNE